MKIAGSILGLALVTLIGCGGASVVDGAGGSDQRGDVDAGGAGGSIGSLGGAPGAGGAIAVSSGGTSGAAGAPATGGSAGSPAGAGGAPGYVSCSVYDWRPTNGGGCIKNGVTGSKDGHVCGVCSAPARPAGVPDCLFGTGSLCVMSCTECTFL